MDQEDLTDDPYDDDDAVIFVAEGLLCEQFDVSIHEAAVALASMAVDCGIGLHELAREVIAGTLATCSFSETYRTTRGAPDH